MGIDPTSRARFDLSKAAILLLDPTPMGIQILSQILTGLGARQLYRCNTLEEAKEVASEFEIHLMIVDGMSSTGEGYDFVRWLRRDAADPNVYAPVLLTTAHTRITDVRRSRDCGAHFMVAKPIAPVVMLERIIWVAKEGRGFLVSDNYIGPDRRFKDEGPPSTRAGLRREDRMRLEAEAKAALDADQGPPRNSTEENVQDDSGSRQS